MTDYIKVGEPHEKIHTFQLAHKGLTKQEAGIVSRKMRKKGIATFIQKERKGKYYEIYAYNPNIKK